MYEFKGKYGVLRDYQRECVTSIYDSFNYGSQSSIVVLPPSAGKTVIVGAVIKRYLDNNINKRAVMLSHLDILTRQNSESLKDFWGLDVGILQGLSIPTGNKRCIVSTMQSFRDTIKQLVWGKSSEVGLVVIDETHFYGSSSYDSIIENLPDDCLVLGVTATPFRSNKDMTNMFDNVSYTISMQELIDMGQLVSPVLNTFPVMPKESPVSIHKKIVRIYADRHKGEKSIVFCKTIDECNDLANLFRSQGINSSAITSKFTGKQRDEVIESFKNNSEGSPDVLTTVNVLTAGFSSNNVRSIFMPYKVTSVSTYLQRIGRSMRLDDNKTHSDIYAGGESPEISREYYEKLQHKALAAREPSDEEFEEIADDIYDEDGIMYSQDTIELSNDLKEKGLGELSSLIKKKDFPSELLDNLIEQRHIKSKSLTNKRPTSDEIAFLTKHGIDSSNMNGLDSLYMVSAILESKGINRSSLYSDYSGNLSGAPFRAIPHIAKKFIKPNDKARFYSCNNVNKTLYSNLKSL